MPRDPPVIPLNLQSRRCALLLFTAAENFYSLGLRRTIHTYPTVRRLFRRDLFPEAHHTVIICEIMALLRHYADELDYNSNYANNLKEIQRARLQHENSECQALSKGPLATFLVLADHLFCKVSNMNL